MLPPVPEAPVLGLSLSEITDALRSQYTIGKDVAGVVITAVTPGSNAADKGVLAGEVIVEVAQEPVAKPEDVTARLDALRKDGRKVAQFLIANSAGELRFVSLLIDP